MSIDMSLDAKLYRGEAGQTAATEVNTCKDVSLKIKKGEAKISSRASRWALVKGALKEAEFTVSFDSSSDAVESECPSNNSRTKRFPRSARAPSRVHFPNTCVPAL
jgi:hypothetical protein